MTHDFHTCTHGICVVSTLACVTQWRVFHEGSFSVVLVVATFLHFVVSFKPLLVVSFNCLEYLVFHSNCFPWDQ